MGVWARVTRTVLAWTMPRGRWIARGPTDCGAVALTFDDGPHPEHTPRLLDTLGETGVPATFFVVGREAAAHPKLIERMVSEGHQVANHTWTHAEPSKVSAKALMTEVRETGALLRTLTGGDVSLFRPPKGEFTLEKLRLLWRSRQTVALWNVDPKDFAMTAPEQADRWAAAYRPDAGDIVLMHDNHPWGGRMVPEIVSRARDGGLCFTTLREWTTPIGAARVEVTA